MEVPLIGLVQVPLPTLAAEPQEIVPGAKRMSYLAGTPVPSLTSVKDRVTEPVLTEATERLLTVAGLVVAVGETTGGKYTSIMEQVTVTPAVAFPLHPAVFIRL